MSTGELRHRDQVRMTFEGEYLDDGYLVIHHPPGEMCVQLTPEMTVHAKVRELIARPFEQPPPGAIFYLDDKLFISLGDVGFRKLRQRNGHPTGSPAHVFSWDPLGGEDRDDIRVVDL